jgi:subtilisin-like proprotein convertase family protein
MTIQDTALHASTNFDPPLPGSVTTATTPFDWSARWTGQLYAAAAGDYTVRVVSDDGNRIILGGATGGSGFVRNASGQITTNVTAPLVAGWNDLIVDYNHVDTPPTFTLTIEGAPAADAALVGAPIPRERLRPIEPRADRLIPRTTIPQNPGVIVDNAGTSFTELTTRIDAHPGELVSSVAISARVTSPSPNQLVYRLTAPNNQTAAVTMLVTPDPNQVGSYMIAGVSTLTAGMAANGTWKFGIADNSNTGQDGNSSYHELHITAHTTAGPEQIATTAVWRSPIVENATAVALIDFVSWNERAPAGSIVTVKIRTCALPDCSDGTWSEKLANGAAPTVMPLRYLQLQVEMTTDGTHEAEVDKINIQYRTAPPT